MQECPGDYTMLHRDCEEARKKEKKSGEKKKSPGLTFTKLESLNALFRIKV
jgi:hypothetical protein